MWTKVFHFLFGQLGNMVHIAFFFCSDIHLLERESERRNEGRREERKGKENII